MRSQDAQSVDVDFASLRRAATVGFKNVSAWPLQTQGEFLENMAIRARMAKLLEGASEAQQEHLIAGYERLVGVEEGQMGSVYKVLAVTSADVGKPPGFP